MVIFFGPPQIRFIILKKFQNKKFQIINNTYYIKFFKHSMYIIKKHMYIILYILHIYIIYTYCTYVYIIQYFHKILKFFFKYHQFNAFAKFQLIEYSIGHGKGN